MKWHIGSVSFVLFSHYNRHIKKIMLDMSHYDGRLDSTHTFGVFIRLICSLMKPKICFTDDLYSSVLLALYVVFT